MDIIFWMWIDNIRNCLREIRWEGVNWMHVAQERDKWWDVMNTVTNIRVT
jgi:hypothetical protein